MAYDNPKGLIAMSAILEFLAILAVLLRFLARRKAKLGLKVDDWLIVVTLIFGTGLSVMEIYGAAVKALGKPLDYTIEQAKSVDGRLNKTKHIELSFLLLGIAALTFLKLSVVFYYRRLFHPSRWFMWVSFVWIFVIIIWGASFVIAGLAECGHHLLSLFGTPKEYLDHCGSAIPAGWAMVLSDVITDLITLLMPLPLIAKLPLPVTKKLSVASVFLIGLFTVSSSAAKASIYIKATLGLYHMDAIILLTSISVWNYVEVMVGIIAACSITWGPFIDRGDISKHLTRIMSLPSSIKSSLRGKRDSTQSVTSTDSTDVESGTDTAEEKMEPATWDGQSEEPPAPAQAQMTPSGRISIGESCAVYPNSSDDEHSVRRMF